MNYVVGIFIAGLLVVTARAQTSAPVFVAFRFEAQKVVDGFEPGKLAAAERAVSEALAAACEKRRWWWTFKAATNDTQYPRLVVWLEESVDWQIGVEFVANAESPAAGTPWMGLLFKPADFEQLGPTLRRDGWAPTLAARFEREILRRHGAALLAKLQEEAPLGRVLKLPDSATGSTRPPLVLPLEWERYKNLSASLFTIRCKSNAGPVMLHSAGIEAAGPFTHQEPPFEGIAVQICEWQELTGTLVPIEQRLDRLGTLQPVAFFLKKSLPAAWSMAQ